MDRRSKSAGFVGRDALMQGGEIKIQDSTANAGVVLGENHSAILGTMPVQPLHSPICSLLYLSDR